MLSSLRCPRSTCVYHGRRLWADAGQDENRGELTVEYRCWGCGYREFGPSTPTAATKTSDTVKRALTPLRELLYRQRREGVEIPLRYDR